MVFKKSLLLLLLTPFPNYYNGIVKKGKKTLQQNSNKKQTKTENILINYLNNKQKITNNL